MGSPLENYGAATKQLQDTIVDAIKVSAAVQIAAKSLKEWRGARIVGVSGDFPEHLSLKPQKDYITNKPIDPIRSDLPTAKQIADSLIAYHRAKEHLQACYEAVPAAERKLVHKPETFDRDPPASH